MRGAEAIEAAGAAGDRILLSRHARRRMAHRGVRPAALEAALTWGRVVHVRGADIHVLGRREITRAREEGAEDLSRFEGLHAVCAPDGTVITTYRNRDFRGLRR